MDNFLLFYLSIKAVLQNIHVLSCYWKFALLQHKVLCSLSKISVFDSHKYLITWNHVIINYFNTVSLFFLNG